MIHQIGTGQRKYNADKGAMKNGNLGMQKYEARKYMERFYRALTCPQATQETTDWKSKERKKYIEICKASAKRNNGRQRMKEKTWEQENQELGHMIYNLKTENRRETTREAGPGWRVGSLGGPVIDCYPTENPLAKRYAELHGYEKKRERRAKEIKRDNEKLKQDISKLTSNLSADAMQKAYAENRYRARFFFNKTQETALHLGLLKEFKGSRKRPSSAQQPTSSSNTSPQLINKKWNDDVFGARGPHHVNPPWDGAALKEDRRRYSPLYANALSLEKSAISYSPLHAARGTLSFYSEMEELAGAKPRRPASARLYGRGESRLNQMKSLPALDAVRDRPSSAGPTFTPQVLKRSPSPDSDRAKWMDQLPPYARSSAARGESGKHEDLFDLLSRESQSKPAVSPLSKQLQTDHTKPANGQLASSPSIPAPENASGPSHSRRKLCMLESSILVNAADTAAMPMILSISDVGVVYTTGQSEGTPLSSGVLIDIVYAEGGLRGSLSLSINQLRQLCDVTKSEGNLYAELRALHCHDKNAGLYDSISEKLSVTSEQDLCEMLCRLVRAQVSKTRDVLVWI